MPEEQNIDPVVRVSDDPELRKRQLQLLDLQIEEAKDKVTKDKAPKKWSQATIEFLALPTAVVTIAGGIITATGNLHPTHNTVGAASSSVPSVAQPSTGRTGEVSVPVPLSKQNEAAQAGSQQSVPALTSTIAKFILLWILFSVVNLVFEVIDRIWAFLLTGGFMSLNTIRRRLQEGKEQEDDGAPTGKRRGRMQRLAPYFQVVFVVIGQAPSILRWSIQLSLFYILLGPLFDEIAISFGSTTRFSEIMREIEHFQFSYMFATMRQLLFG